MIFMAALQSLFILGTYIGGEQENQGRATALPCPKGSSATGLGSTRWGSWLGLEGTSVVARAGATRDEFIYMHYAVRCTALLLVNNTCPVHTRGSDKVMFLVKATTVR
jgi:hypothetical protein